MILKVELSRVFNKENFCARVLELRLKAGIGQIELAKVTGVGRTAISMIENGQRAASIETIVALADYFNVSIDYLVGRTDDPRGNR